MTRLPQLTPGRTPDATPPLRCHPQPVPTKGRTVNGNNATASLDEVQQHRSHPTWCDPERCTWSDKGGAHYSAWVTLGPFPNTNTVVRAYLYATDENASTPLLMLAMRAPLYHPDDIANNAGIGEDTLAFAV